VRVHIKPTVLIYIIGIIHVYFIVYSKTQKFCHKSSMTTNTVRPKNYYNIKNSTEIRRCRCTQQESLRVAVSCRLLRGSRKRHKTVQCPSVRLSSRATTAAAAGGFPAELGQQISVDSWCCRTTCGPRIFWSDCKEVRHTCLR